MRLDARHGIVLLCLVTASVARDVHYRRADGTWSHVTAHATDGQLRVDVSPAMAPGGEAILVFRKPEWMVLDDDVAPTLRRVTVNGRERAVSGTVLDLGCVPAGDCEVVFELGDDKNPISRERTDFGFQTGPGVSIEVDRTGLGGPGRTGRLTVRLSRLVPGRYVAELALVDRAPLANTAMLPVSFTVFGVSISPDRQQVTLAAAGASYVVQPHLSNQIMLPGGIAFKLTTNLAGKWLYPRAFLSVETTTDSPQRKTVLIRADAQGLDGKPVEGLGEIEFELTVRPDTPCLLIRSRAINVSGKPQGNSCNWGWLPAEYYVTPAGKQAWKSKTTKAYETIGKIGWVWLAPAAPGKPGLVWASPQRFGESRFASMLLYSESMTSKNNEFVEMQLAIGPAETPAVAEAIYKHLLAEGLVPPP